MWKLAALPMDIALFVIFVSYSLFFKKRELGLIGIFVFVYYLGFIFGISSFIALEGEVSLMTSVYGFGGFALICLFLIGLSNKQYLPSEPQNQT